MFEKETVIQTRAGKIGGIYEEGLYVFRGIPYAAPPIDELRWLPPQPVKPWKGVYWAQNFGAIAPQNYIVPDYRPAPILPVQSEDCLYLNVLSPGLDDSCRPVLFWIHGGGFISGVSIEPMNKLASSGDVVVVSTNYRLGSLGFLNLNEITGGRIPATGNEGLLDQIAALEWVHDNITVFGGDPDNVTVIGHSAGAMSIGCLLAMPKARGLFNKAILQSGAANVVAPLNRAIEIAEEFVKILGVSGKNSIALQSISVERLLSAQQKQFIKMQRDKGCHLLMPPLTMSPVIDGEIIPQTPIDAIKSGAAANVPILVGCTLEECKVFINPDSYKLDEAELVRRCRLIMPPEHVPTLISSYRNARTKRGTDTSPFEIFQAIETDIIFRVPGTQLVEAQYRRNLPAYNYLFTWKSPPQVGVSCAGHGLDVGFLFGTYDDKLCGSGPSADRLSKNIQASQWAFARSGDPSCKSLGSWPPYGERRKTMILGAECHIEEAPLEEERSAWNQIPDYQPLLSGMS